MIHKERLKFSLFSFELLQLEEFRLRPHKSSLAVPSSSSRCCRCRKRHNKKSKNNKRTSNNNNNRSCMHEPKPTTMTTATSLAPFPANFSLGNNSWLNETAYQVIDRSILQQGMRADGACTKPSAPVPPPSQPWTPITEACTGPDGVATPPISKDAKFVNMYLSYDPNEQKFYFPKQVISYKVGDVVSKMVVGPTRVEYQEKVVSKSSSPAVVSEYGSSSASSSSDEDSSHQMPTLPLSTTATEVGELWEPTPYESPPSSSTTNSPLPVPADARFQSFRQENTKEESTASSSTHQTTNPPVVVTTGPKGLPPLRALSAYNFFFRDERDRILNGSASNYTSTKEMKLLSDHWHQDRTKKRRHRKSHGRIDFTTLSKLISSRWKQLPAHHKAFYRKVAQKDFERYQREHQNLCTSLQTFTKVVG